MGHRVPRCYSLSWTLSAVVAGTLAASMGQVSDASEVFETPTIRDAQVKPTVCRECESQHSGCELICCPQKIAETEKKPFWKVTCDYVCIPGFRLPWECKKNVSGCDCLVCGSVRAVNILEQGEYECKTCGYKWEVKCVRRSGDPERAKCPCPRCAERERTRLAAQREPARK